MYQLEDLFRLTGHSPTPAFLRAANLGLLLPLFAEKPQFAGRALAWHVERLSAALAIGQLRVCFDRFGRFCGHVMWTSASAEMELELLQHGPDAVDAQHLCSGNNAWIVDMSAFWGEFPQLLTVLRDDWLRGQAAVGYFRYKGRRRQAKRMSFARCASLYRQYSESLSNSVQPILERGEGNGLLHACGAILDAAIEAGHFFSLMCNVPEHAQLPLGAAVYRLRSPLSQLQRRMYLADDGTPAGFITWALLDLPAYPEKRFSALTLQPHQWNAGRDLCLMDAIITPGCQEAVRADLAGALFPERPLSVSARWELPEPGCFRTFSSTQRKELAVLPISFPERTAARDLAFLMTRAAP